MKRLSVLLLLIPAILVAQENERYLPGAVPVVDGKVVFTKEVADPSLTQDQLFDLLLNWAEGRFKDEKSRVAYQNKDKGEYAVTGTEKLVFASTAISYDAADMLYHLVIECTGNKAEARFENISYKYDVSYERKPQRLIAEEVITDKYALTKKNKLNRINGKFRKGTVDFVDQVFGEIDLLFKRQTTITSTTSPIQKTTPALQQPTAQPSIVTTALPKVEQSVKEGYMSFEVDKVPQAILAMLPNSPMQITPGQAASPVETNASWKGISEMFGKKVATVTLSDSSPVYAQIKDIFTISFMKEGSEAPWMIIECNKQGETTDGTNKAILGEIQQIWIK